MSRVAGGKRTRVVSDHKLLETHLVLPVMEHRSCHTLARSLALSSLALSIFLMMFDNVATYTSGRVQQLGAREWLLEVESEKAGLINQGRRE